MTNSQKIHLLDQNGKAYTNLDESMRPYLKSLTPEQFEEDKNWWCTALEITGNQQSTFTIGQIVGNVISQVWDQIPALSRIKEWHKQAVDPSAACMEEANQVAKYFMMIHPRQTFQYIDNNGGKKGKSARYKMIGAVTEITLGSDINWDNQKHLAWRFGKTNFCGSCNNFKELFKQISLFLAKLDTSILADFIYESAGCWIPDDVLPNPEMSVCISSDETHNNVTEDFGRLETLIDSTLNGNNGTKDFALLMVPDCIDQEEHEKIFYSYDIEGTVFIPCDRQHYKAGLYLYLLSGISNNEIMVLIKKLFDIYGLSYDDLKIQFI